MTIPLPLIHVVDDDDSLRTAVTRLLRAAGYESQGYASVGEYLLAEGRARPGCLVLDVHLPGPSGLDFQAALARQGDAPPVVFLTGEGDIPMSVRAIQAGAVDFLTKPVQRETLLRAVRRALTQDEHQRQRRSRLAELQARFDELTEREREVFALVVAGRLNKQIAAELGAAERTVKAHRASVMDKLHAQCLAELVLIAQQLGVTGA